jgi:A/G-specific adenine glycosylase
VKKPISSRKLKETAEVLWTYYDEHGRHDLPWRKQPTPYHVVVSEIMLQQTQVIRVEEYYKRWLKQFPTWRALSLAPLRDVLLAWQGLGYNRRGKYLHDIAKAVTNEHNGRLPADRTALEALPGIGHYTAGSIRAFTFNQLDIFLETNIRTVLFYHLYDYEQQSLKSVPDKDLLELLEKLIARDKRARESPRDFYYAMMDYGAHLKKTIGNLNRQSKSYTKQSPFKGSRRQLRAQILKFILKEGPVSMKVLHQEFADEALTTELVQELRQDSGLKKVGKRYQL